jgi:hypothetical protein
MAETEFRSVRRDGDQIVVLADVSPSMEVRDGGSREGKKRINLLREALSGLPKGIKIIAFSDEARVTTAEGIRVNEYGSTALHKAIDLAATFDPVRTVIISDGEPDSEEEAERAIEGLTGIVDVVYCGDPDSERASKFLESLAKAGAGGFYETGDQIDVCKQLPAVIAGLLNP